MKRAFWKVCAAHGMLLRVAEKDSLKTGQAELFKKKKQQAIDGD